MKPVPMICVYKTKRENAEKFAEYLAKHWPALRQASLASEKRATIERGMSKDGSVYFIERFEWKEPSSPGIAHQTPEVMAIWEPMGALTQQMDFIQLES